MLVEHPTPNRPASQKASDPAGPRRYGFFPEDLPPWCRAPDPPRVQQIRCNVSAGWSVSKSRDAESPYDGSHLGELLETLRRLSGDKLALPELERLADIQGQKPATDEAIAAQRRRTLRRELYRLQDAYREHAPPTRGRKGETRPPRLPLCGRARLTPGGAVEIQRADPEIGSSHRVRCQYSGLVTCHSKGCPVCIQRRRSKQAGEIERVISLWLESHRAEDGTEGASVYFTTLTLAHGMLDTLVRTGHGLRDCWRKFLQGRAWKAKRAELGIEQVIAAEALHGANGWHPHMHVYWLFPKRLTSGQSRSLKCWIFDRWQSIVTAKLGGQYRPMEKGFDFRRVRLDAHGKLGARYLAKLGLELAAPGTKQRKRADAGRTPLELLTDWTNERDRIRAALEAPPGASELERGARRREADKRAGALRDLELYQEWHKAMHGRRDLTWSRGLQPLREKAAAELEDEDRERRAARRRVALLPSPTWLRVMKVPYGRAGLLEAGEAAGLAGVCDWLRRNVGSEDAAVVKIWTGAIGERTDPAPPPF